MSKHKYSALVIIAAICIAMTPFGGLKLAGRGISLYLYAIFAVFAVRQIYLDKGKLYIEKTQWLFIALLLFFLLSYIWTPAHGGNAVVEGDHSAFVKGSYFILILMLFDYSEKDKQLLQLFSLLGTIAMAFYMIFNSAGTYALQFSNRITLAIGDSVTEVNYLSFLLIIPTGYAISSILNQETNKFLKVLYGISVLLLLYILLFTGSRAGILSIIGTAFFSVIMTLFKSRRIQPRAFLAFFILGIVVIVVAPMIYEQLPETIVRRISIQNFLLATSGANGRVDIWKRAFDTMRADNSVFHMFFGNGFLSAQVTFGLTLHNLFIQVLFEQGLVGIVTLIILFYRIIRDSIATKNVMVLSETIGVLILCMSLAGVISRFFWICLAMLIICSRPNRTSEEEEYA